MGPGFGGYSGFSGCLGGLGGGFGMMFIWILVIGAVIYFFMKGQNNNNNNNSAPLNNNNSTNANALEIAKGRLAKGEITTEEYENIKKSLL